MFETLSGGIRSWIAGLATVVLDLGDRLAPPPVIDVAQSEEGWTVRRSGAAGAEVLGTIAPDADGGRKLRPDHVGTQLAGAQVRVQLPASWAIRRSLDTLPTRSLPFIDAFVRHQIERVTPWRASDCHFAVATAPAPQTTDRMTIAIVAIPRNVIDPVLAPLLACRPRTLTLMPEGDGEGISLAAGAERRRAVVERLTQAAVAILLAGLIAAAGAGSWRRASLESEIAGLDEDVAQRQQQLSAAIARRSATAAQDRAGGLRMHRAPVVQLLDSLAELLPDHTYLTDFRLEGQQIQIAGVSQEVNSLIPVIERSGVFRDATFQAPTTRLADRPGDRFAIEMRIAAPNAARQEAHQP